MNLDNDHSASVALSSRISKDPKGAPVRENITEKYHKTVSTDFELQHGRKRHSSEASDDSGDDHHKKVSFIDTPNPPPQECVDPIIETLWKRILSLESQIPPVIAPMGSRKLPCFDFQKSGHCARGEACRYFHDPAAKHSKRQRSPSPPRKEKDSKKVRSRSPRRHHTPPRHRSPPSRKRTWSPPPRALF